MHNYENIQENYLLNCFIKIKKYKIAWIKENIINYK